MVTAVRRLCNSSQLMNPHRSAKASAESKGRWVSRYGREIRSLFDKQYRRAYRNLQHLPRREYRFVIDGGANRGAFTDALLQLHRPERIVLVEAIPNLAEKLRARYASEPSISVVSAAL